MNRRENWQQELERSVRAHPAGRALRGAAVAEAGEWGRPGALAGRSPERVPLRLTARGRRLVAVLGIAAGVGTAALVGSLVGAGPSGGLQLAGESSVVVRSGDTLWSIASSMAGEEDVRAVVDRIQAANGLQGSDLVPGQVLRLP